MTVQSTNNRSDHTGTGTATTFMFDYLLLDAAHMQVYLNNVLTPSGWSIPPGDIGNQNGGNVIFDVAPADQVKITLLRIVPNTQLVDYRQYDKFPSQTHESALDLLTMQIQQIVNEDNRALVHPLLEELTGEQKTLPPLEQRRSSYLLWDENGVPQAGADPLTTPTSAWGAIWVQLANDLAARNQLDVRRRHAKNGVPDANDDLSNGFAVDDIIRDTNTNLEYVCRDDATGSAVWEQYQTGGGGGSGGAYLGEIKYFTGAIPTISDGWLPLGTTTYSTTTNPEFQPIYDYMVAVWGAGEIGPANAFRTPPIDARFILTAGPGVPNADPEVNVGPRTVGTKGGKEAHRQTASQTANHGHEWNRSGSAGDGTNLGALVTDQAQQAVVAAHDGTPTGAVGEAIGGNRPGQTADPMPTMPPYAVCNGAICWNPALQPRVANFIELDDTPLNYAGSAAKSAVVAPAQNSMLFQHRVSTIQSAGTDVETEAHTLNFEGAVTVEQTSAGVVKLTFTGGGGGPGGIGRGSTFVADGIVVAENVTAGSETIKTLLVLGDGELLSRQAGNYVAVAQGSIGQLLVYKGGTDAPAPGQAVTESYSDGSVTNIKRADVPYGRIQARATTGAGPPEDVRAIDLPVHTPAAGDVLVGQRAADEALVAFDANTLSQGAPNPPVSKGQLWGHNGTNAAVIPAGNDGEYWMRDDAAPTGVRTQAPAPVSALPALGRNALDTDKWIADTGSAIVVGTVAQLLGGSAGNLVRSVDEGSGAGNEAQVINVRIMKQTPYAGHTKQPNTLYLLVDDSVVLP